MRTRISKETIDNLFKLLESGRTFEDSSKALGYSTEGLRQYLRRNGLYEKARAYFSKYSHRATVGLKDMAEETEGQPQGQPKPGRYDDLIQRVKEMTSPDKKTAPAKELPPVQVRVKSLADFTPREIFKYLYRLGYRIEGGRVFLITKTEVNMYSIIHE